MSRVWLARTWARSNGSSGGTGRWVSFPSPPSSPSIPRGIPAPIPEAVGVVLSEAICHRGERITTMHMPYFFLKHVILFSTPVHYKHTTTTDYTTHERFLGFPKLPEKIIKASQGHFLDIGKVLYS
jgi:hypothetical protein